MLEGVDVLALSLEEHPERISSGTASKTGNRIYLHYVLAKLFGAAMGEQVQGLVGRAVDGMIRRSVRRTFRGIYWQQPARPAPQPAIYVPNHHGWHDGYLMYLALSELGLHGFHDWIAEFDSFPPFAAVGGMPFPPGDPSRRAATIRRTLRLMAEEHRSLILFAEGILHRPPELLTFGKSLELLANRVPEAKIIPVAIRYEHSMHERPEGYLLFGSPMERGPELSRRTRLEVSALLDRLAADLAVAPERFELLYAGTRDVNERMSLERLSRITGWTRQLGKSAKGRSRIE